MPFIRLSDNYIDHPKFIVLSDRAFRLWHEGMAYCRKHQTDGLIPSLALQGFRYAKRDAIKELTVIDAPLWETVDGFGYRVHDYLDWNESREVEQKRQQEARERTKRWRAGAPKDPPCDASGDVSRDASQHANVPDRSGMDHRSSEGVPGKPSAMSAAVRVRDAFMAAWKAAYGYESSVQVKPLELFNLEGLVRTHTEARLLQGVRAFFATDDAYIRRAKHSLPLFLRDPLKYLAGEPRVSVRPRGCQHTPPCADDVAHTKRLQAELKAQAS